ncbi:MAG TPA: two-component regulator propeller domain-containing protein [Bacteroidota bacterium]|nr:two-component regulator propeller domain-containing protein [Bacteroidota bacterium]
MTILRIARTRLATVFVLALPVICPGSLPAQESSPLRPLNQFVHDVWTAHDGLPQNGVYSLHQTHDGYIWFGSQEGLVRFDGVRFTVFDRTNTKEMTRGWVLYLMEDTDDNLWISYSSRAAGAGLYRNGVFRGIGVKDGLHNNTVRFTYQTRDSSVWFLHFPWGITRDRHGVMSQYGVAQGLPSDTVWGVSDDSHGNFWFATPEGIVRSTPGGNTLFSKANGMPANRVWWLFPRGNCMFEDSRGAVWMPTDSGLVRYMDGALRTFTMRDGLLDNRVYAIDEDKSGTLWLVSTSGITSIAGSTIRGYKPPVPFDVVNDFLLDANNSLWVASLHGLWRFRAGAFDHFGRENGMTDETINTVFIDAEGSVWFGTDSGGLHRLREGKFVTYGTEAGLKDQVISAVMEDSRRNLWVGTMVGGITRFSGGTVTTYGRNNGLEGQIFIITEDPKGGIWVIAQNGLFKYENGKMSPYALEPKPAVSRALLYRRNGDLLLADASRIYTLNGHRLKQLIPQQVPGGSISNVIEDAHGTLWVGSFGFGLYRVEGDSLRHFTPEDGFSAVRVYGMHADSDGNVWVGTEDDGAYLWRGGKFTHYTPASGLFAYTASNIIEDNAGSMWFSNNKGVFRIKKQALIDFADGKISSYTYDAYGTADGMKSAETNFLGAPSIWTMHDGKVAIPTVNGVAVVDPASIRLNTVPPRVVLERFTADNSALDLDSDLRLSPGTNNLEFQYVGLSFIGSDRVQYRYKLDGYDKDWVNPGTRTVAYYTHLGPGDYRFSVRAANADGVWDTTGASVSFAIRPHFYEAGWFYAFLVIGIVFVGPSIYLLRVRQLKQREIELETQVENRTKELRGALDNLKETQNQLVLSEKMASLGQLTAGIAHEIKNPLNFITNFAALSGDLAKELRQELVAERDHVEPRRAAEIGTLLDDLEQNVQKINDHGKRADSIVRGMLLHSRGKAGERLETDLNALLAEYTNLAYHGMRAQDATFNIKIETDFDPAVGKVSVVPQDLSRAFLNIVNNACYAANERKKASTNGFSPVVRVSARNMDDSVEIRVRDNGTGIPRAIVDKIFNPFFTTKPAGVGTGLGLSLTYDIITQEHRGQIRVDTKENEFTEFIITIPRNPGNDGGNRA